METKNLALFSSSKKLTHFTKDLEEELKSIAEDLQLSLKTENIRDYVFILECKVHEKSFVRYICCDPSCPYERLLCSKCVKDSPHFEAHKSHIQEYQRVLEEKYQELWSIHDKLSGNLQIIENKNLESSREKIAYKKAKTESRKSMMKFKKMIEEMKEKIKSIYHEIITKVFEISLSNYGKFIQDASGDLKIIEEETIFINENLQELEKILKSRIDHSVLEKLITEYAPYFRNNGLKDILASLKTIETRVFSFEILGKTSEPILLKEFLQHVTGMIDKLIDENISKYEKRSDEIIEKKRVNIKNLIRNKSKQIHKPGKFSNNKSSIGKSTTHSMKNFNWTEGKKKI